jgi:hypothetical protein
VASLQSIFDALGGDSLVSANELASPGDSTFVTARLDGFPRFRLGRDSEGRPAFLISGCKGIEGEAPVELKNLAFNPNAECLLRTATGQERLQLALLRCKTGEEGLQLWFLRLLEVYMGLLGPNPDSQRIVSFVNELVSLFHSLSRPSRGTVVGLWGELALILASRDPAPLVAAWHSDPAEIHDFVAGIYRMEVKTTTLGMREHRFSLEQLLVPDGTSLVIASVLVQENPAGQSIDELVLAIGQKLHGRPELVTRVHAIVAATLGEDWERSRTVRLALSRGGESIYFIDGSRVPSPGRDLPPEVSHVRFTADISGIEPLAPDELIRLKEAMPVS